MKEDQVIASSVIPSSSSLESSDLPIASDLTSLSLKESVILQDFNSSTSGANPNILIDNPVSNLTHPLTIALQQPNLEKNVIATLGEPKLLEENVTTTLGEPKLLEENVISTLGEPKLLEKDASTTLPQYGDIAPPEELNTEMGIEGMGLSEQTQEGDSDFLQSNPVISARNASYWLQRAVIMRSSSDLDIDLLPTVIIETEDVYENQRYQPVLGWGSRGRLLPLDPEKFSDRLGKKSWIVFPTIRLPRPTVEGSWEWATPWHIDFKYTKCDVEGWSYGSSFSSMKAGTIYGSMQGNTYVRRRRWIRQRKFVPVGEPSEGAFDESYLDCVAGWLCKLGHRRKNWKKRFFILEGSTLKYFADNHRMSFKGEVLLFKEDTQVRYVDIHVSGKDNTFVIESGEYSLLLQAQSLEDRENWIYGIEDALLCRDSYTNDTATRQRRDNVSRRRTISKDVLRLSSNMSDLSPLPSRKDTLTKLLSSEASAIASSLVNGDPEHHAASSQFVRTFQTQQRYYLLGMNNAKEGLKKYRDYTESMLSEILDRCGNSIYGRNPGADSETWALVVRDAILHEIERIAFIPLQNMIYQLLQLSVDPVKHQDFKRKKNWLSQQQENFFEIDESHLSSTQWEASSILFGSMDNFSLPSEKATLLIEVVRSIYETDHYEHARHQSMAADDFFPIFIFVICKSNLLDLFITTELISSTMIYSVGVGETGYYVTMLEAAVEYIASFNSPHCLQFSETSPHG